MRPVLLALLLAAAPAFAGTPLPDAPHVTATGEGKVSVAPDLARINLTARYSKASPLAAKQAVDRSVEAFLELAPRFGLEPAHVTAGDLSVSEDIDTDDNGRKVSNGFVARRDLKIEFRALARLGEFLDAALAAGINEVDDIGFESSRADALRVEARAKAVADAREKAGGLAEAFGATLGPVYSINSLNSSFADRYGGDLDRIEVTGSRIRRSRYVQPTVDYSERVATVFELKR
ncbi:SIMPL domain-containing protein [Lysobacter xanthus]